ncbi:hypothetical protein [Gluconobacter japonicus]|uniref:hypothetical protein n=1 Tax=Gluconobacter japonicus TaxID=376620 RepID=UPI000A6A33F1|nr:hypothetical protein [Gluconobacter japonicus]
MTRGYNVGNIFRRYFSEIFALAAFIFFCVVNFKGLGHLSFGDETGHVLGARALAKHQVLYRDYIDAHGPLIFSLSWTLGKIVGFSHLYRFRLLSTLLAFIAAASLYYSPLFQIRRSRFLALAIWFGTLSAVWVLQGLNMDSYWPLGGALTVIVLAKFAMPLAAGAEISVRDAFYGGFAALLLPFAAYSFLPATACFFLALGWVLIVSRKNNVVATQWRAFLYGGIAAVAFNILWLAVYGDLMGAIAFHFVSNQFYYSKYTALGFSVIIDSLKISFGPNRIIQSLAVYGFLFGSALVCIRSRYRVAAFLACMAVFSLDARGSFLFQNGAFLMASLGLLSLAVAWVFEQKSRTADFLALGSVALAQVVGIFAISTPFNESSHQVWHSGFHPEVASQDLTYQTIRKYASPDEGILVIPYNPDVYILADRLPMLKYHDYLPWEADYGHHPWAGQERDLCVDLPKYKPPVVYFDDWRVWGMWSLSDYAHCVTETLKNDYVKLPGFATLYVQKDRFASTP